MIKVGLFGLGKMGYIIAKLIVEENKDELRLVSVLEKEDSPNIGKNIEELGLKSKDKIRITSSVEEAVEKADVLIDFSVPQATVNNINKVLESGKKLVIGTTGFDTNQLEIIQQASKSIPILISANMSFGVNLMFKLIREMTKVLKDYDIELIEVHHKYKKDAPSGTAKELIKIIKEEKPKSFVVYGREGITGPRRPQEIGVFSLRAADIVGEHTIIFATEGERLELTHRAYKRDIFAKGAIKAAKFIYHTKRPGLYSMYDVLAWTG
jgi:4-hydroxy-tetrahydrodipicolinate reductase